MRFCIYLGFFTMNICGICHSYNIDSNSPLIKTFPLANKSLFGFSLSIFSPHNSNTKYILVGSPTAQVENSKTHKSGALYSCPVTHNYQDCTQRSIDDKSVNSLYGYTIDTNDVDQSIYTCAPRFLKSLYDVKYVEGMCWQLNDQYEYVDTVSNKECVNAIKLDQRTYSLRNCLTGGAVKSMGNKELLVTAPYSYEGRGLLVISTYATESNSRESRYLRIHQYMSKYQMTGLSMTTGNIIRKRDVRTVVLGAPGMPQSNLTNHKMGYGQVMLVELLNGTLTFHGLLFGDSFGSAFGYSVLAIDLNNDGHEELIVGAPFTGNNRGKVFVYWNQNIRESNEAGFSFHLTLTNPTKLQSSNKDDSGQFGNCLENIGDLNQDSYLDFAVGSPFENDGRGSVYIYLGSGDLKIHLSQKIEANKIDPDFRGFGFSIFGRNTDIDGNKYPDVVVGAVISGHVVGLRTRPLVSIYAENMLNKSDFVVPYSLSTLSKCRLAGHEVGCVEIKIQLFYSYLNQVHCSPSSPSILVNYTLNLDKAYLRTSLSKRVHFGDRSNIIRDSAAVECKPPSQTSLSNNKRYNVIFPDTVFFNISQPIEIYLQWSMVTREVPIRNYLSEEKLIDLNEYPVMDRGNSELINKILFGAGCTPETCKPILKLDSRLSLDKVDDEYVLYIGASSTFTLNVEVKNIATLADNRAYNSFIRLDYSAIGIIPTSISPGQYRSSSTGLIYVVQSPLEVNTLEVAQFVFSLSNDFMENAEKYIYLNISLDAMCKQPHLKPITMKIRVRMVANINMKVSVAHIDTTSYNEAPTIGISAIKDEKKIGPRLKMTISLSNTEHASVVVSSKLVIFFPWEVAGDPAESHGQYLLYLQSLPKFFVSGGKRNITCDSGTLEMLVNPINTKMFESLTDSSQLRDVSTNNVSIPKKSPKPQSLRKDLALVSISDIHQMRSEWDEYVLLNCMNGSARCVPIVCNLGPLSKQSGEIYLEIDFRIWIHTFVENFIKYKFVQTEIPVFWVPDADYDIVLKHQDQSFKLVEIKADNLQKPKASPSMDFWLAVIIATVIGVMVLATIILILYKCHFFRRQNLAAVRKRRRVSKQL